MRLLTLRVVVSMQAMKLSVTHLNILLYIAKCITGTVLLFAVGQLMPGRDISWVFISMLLVLSPDSKEAIPLMMVRVKSNLVASAVTLLCLLLCPDVMIAICIAMAITIVLCHVLDLMAGSRAALAAVVIIALHPPGPHLWSISIERVVAVVAGCLLGLVLTFVFHRSVTLTHRMKGDRASE